MTNDKGRDPQQKLAEVGSTVGIKPTATADSLQTELARPESNEIVDKSAVTERNPSLHYFYSDKKSQGTKFVRSVRKAKISQFTADDRNLVLSELEILDPTFQKTADLARATLSSEPSSAISDWIESALQQQLRKRYEWSPAIGVPRSNWLTSIVRAISRDFKAKDLILRKASYNLLTVSLLSLDLSAFEAIEILDKALPHRNAASSPDLWARAALRVLAKTTTPSTLLNQIDFVRPWRDRLRKSEEALRPLNDNLTDLTEKTEALEIKCSTQQTELDAFRISLTDSLEKVRTLERRLEERQQLAEHDMRQLRSHSRGWLETKIVPILQDALDAASNDSPRVTIVKERLGIALSRIGEERDWLKSSE